MYVCMYVGDWWLLFKTAAFPAEMLGNRPLTDFLISKACQLDRDLLASEAFGFKLLHKFMDFLSSV